MPKIIHLSDINETHWKNGGGMTQELFRLPLPGSTDDFIFRLSIAQVRASGDFSIFPDIDRTLMLIKGSGLLLKRTQNKELLLNQPLSPIHFKGEEPIKAEILCGPVRDFNVMTHRHWGKSSVTIKDFSKNENITFKNKDKTFLFQESGNVDLNGKNYGPETLWIIEENENISLMAQTDITFIEVILSLYDRPKS